MTAKRRRTFGIRTLWSDDELGYLRATYAVQPASVIAVKLGRTTSSVRSRAWAERLNKRSRIKQDVEPSDDFAIFYKILREPQTDSRFMNVLLTGCYCRHEGQGTHMKKLTIAVALLLATAAAPASAATVYNLATDFGKPTFTYGSGTAGSTFKAFSTTSAGGCFNQASFACASDGADRALPTVGVNTSATPISFDTVVLNPGVLLFHPGNSGGTDALVKFTAQFAGTYVINFLASRLDTTANGNGVDLSVGVGGKLSVRDDTYYLNNSAGNSVNYQRTVDLAKGAEVIFGVGNHGEYSYDATGFSGTITAAAAVPETATWAMMIIGFGAIGGAMRRRKSKVTTNVSFA